MQLSQLCSQTGAAGCFVDPVLHAALQFPLFDLDGDTVRLYTDGTTRDGPGTQTLFCGTRRVMTLDGCNGPGIALDGRRTPRRRWGSRRASRGASPGTSPSCTTPWR